MRRSWTCDLIQRGAEMIIFLGVFEFDVAHPDLGEIKKGTRSYEYYWLDRWYNVFRFDEPDGRFRNFYCNVNMPPVLGENSLEYIDLDIDILAWPDGRVIDLDLEEFGENALRYRYPDDVKLRAESAVDELKQMIASRQFPFEHNYFTR